MYLLVNKVFSHAKTNGYAHFINVCVFASEEILFTCKDKCIRSCLNVQVFTSEECLFTREKKNYMLMYKCKCI
jgi:hypothetical protein